MLVFEERGKPEYPEKNLTPPIVDLNTCSKCKTEEVLNILVKFPRWVPATYVIGILNDTVCNAGPF